MKKVTEIVDMVGRGPEWLGLFQVKVGQLFDVDANNAFRFVRITDGDGKQFIRVKTGRLYYTKQFAFGQNTPVILSPTVKIGKKMVIPIGGK